MAYRRIATSRVVVALTDAAPVALGDVRRAPGAVQVVHGHHPGLDVGADAELAGGSDDDVDLPVAARREQAGLLGVVAGRVHEPDPGRVHPVPGQQVAQLLRRRSNARRVLGVPRSANTICSPPRRGWVIPSGVRYGSWACSRQIRAIRAAATSTLLGSPKSLQLVAGARRDEAHVEGGLASVAGDLEHVVGGGVDLAGLDRLGALPELGHVRHHLIGGRDEHRFGCVGAVGAGRDRGGGQVQLVGGFHVPGRVPHPQQFGHVGELGEPGRQPVVAGSGGRQLDLGDGAREGGRPRVEVGQPGRVQQVRAQVALHRVHLGHRVGDRGRGGPGDHPVPVRGPQQGQFHVQVGGSFGALDAHPGDVGGQAQVLVVVQLVDDQVVDPGLLPASPRVAGHVQRPFEPFLLGLQLALNPFHRQRPARPAAGLAGPLQLGVQRCPPARPGRPLARPGTPAGPGTRCGS